MKKLFLTLVAFVLSASAVAQTNIGTVSIEQLGTANDVDAVCTATNLDIRDLTATDVVTCNAGTNLNTSTLSTSANQATIIGHVDGIEGALATIAGAVSGAEMQVDVLTMPTVTVTGPLTDTELRATAVPVTANAGTNLNTSALLTTTAHDAAFGTAGTADAQVRTVQGVVSMTPLLVDGSGVTQPVSGTVTANLSATDNAVLDDIADGITVSATNLDVQIGGSDSLTIGTMPNEGQQTAANSISVTQDTDNDAIGATGAAPPGEVVDIGGRTSGADTTGLMTGLTVCDSVAVVNVASATTTLLITGVANRHWRICALNLVVGAAQGVALITGTGATCGTSTAAVNGGTTGATGWQFAANGGLTQGSGIGEIMSSKVTGGATGDSMCIVTSTTAQTSGAVSYALY